MVGSAWRLAPQGGLVPWQERRAKAMLLDHLDGDLSLSDLAEACGLSVRHFSRAFKATTGEPPHRWLLRQRVEHAKERLAGTNDTLGAIALACGFADHSHFSRVFRALTAVAAPAIGGGCAGAEPVVMAESFQTGRFLQEEPSSGMYNCDA